MATQPLNASHVADFVFKVGDLEPDVLRVTDFEGSEGISGLFRFHVRVCSSQSDLDPAEFVGLGAALEIAGSSGRRYVNGIVSEFERLGDGSRLTHYAVEVVPIHWLLTRRRQSKIFQATNCSDMTIPGIVRQVMKDAGLPDDVSRWALSGAYTAREYVVQYRETDFAFISRLLEQEGIFYFFEHTSEGHKMVFGDSPTAHVATPDLPEVMFHVATGLVPDQGKEVIYRLRDRHRVQIGAVTLRDFNFTKPKVNLHSSVTADKFTSLEESDFPGEYEVKADGDRYAKVRLEEHQAARRVLRMSATCRALVPGYKFTLSDHPIAALNQEYLVTQVDVIGRQPQSAENEAGGELGQTFEADVLAIPASTPFRPPRVTPIPSIRGTQTAVVVGPSGSEIHTDEYGRVKVQFHWDRAGKYDENSSCFIRVSQGWAGGNYGIQFLPRIGQEVIVDFLEGDPDRPIITGRVFNAEQMPPYKLPDECTKSTIKSRSSVGGGGFNEIRFEDAKDKEQFFMHAQKSMDVRVLEDSKEWIGRDRHLIVKRDQLEQVERDQHLMVKGDQKAVVEGNSNLRVKVDQIEQVEGVSKRTVKKEQFTKVEKDAHFLYGAAYAEKVTGNVDLTFEAEHKEQIKGDAHLKCDANRNEEIGSNLSINVKSNADQKVSSNYALDAGANIHIKGGANVVVEAGAALTLKVGGNFVSIDASGVSVVGTIVKINSGGAAGAGAGANPTAPAAPTAPAEPADPEAPTAPLEADKADPGKDTTFQASPSSLAAISPQAVALRTAAESGAPFCQKCDDPPQEEQTAKDDTPSASGASSPAQIPDAEVGEDDTGFQELVGAPDMPPHGGNGNPPAGIPGGVPAAPPGLTGAPPKPPPPPELPGRPELRGF